jgi:hypothetical protein
MRERVRGILAEANEVPGDQPLCGGYGQARGRHRLTRIRARRRSSAAAGSTATR